MGLVSYSSCFRTICYNNYINRNLVEIIVSLESHESLDVAFEIREDVAGFKINHIIWYDLLKPFYLELFQDKEVFVDFKLWDTPNTMRTVIQSVIERGGTMITVNTYNNPAALEEVSKFKDDIKILGVTYLTSWADKEQYEICQEMQPIMWRRHLKRMHEYNFAGVISSAHDIKTIREWGDEDHELLNICPGITVETPDGLPFHSGQVRTTSPKEAQGLGADYIVVGRAVTAAEDPVKIVKEMKDEIE